MPAVRILIIEDERKVAQALQRGFRGEGHDAVVAASGEDGFFRAGWVRNEWNRFITCGAANQDLLWSILMFQSWLDTARDGPDGIAG